MLATVRDRIAAPSMRQRNGPHISQCCPINMPGRSVCIRHNFYSRFVRRVKANDEINIFKGITASINVQFIMSHRAKATTAKSHSDLLRINFEREKTWVNKSASNDVKDIKMMLEALDVEKEDESSDEVS